jgi:predicted O-methyltransferase YrrM
VGPVPRPGPLVSSGPRAPPSRPPEAAIPSQGSPPPPPTHGDDSGTPPPRAAGTPTGGGRAVSSAGVGKAGRDYAETYLSEDPVLVSARARADEASMHSIGPAGGAALRVLAALTGARHVIEIGTGTGVSGTWLLRGMRPDGVLTSIDADPWAQQQARQTFREADFPPSRVRLIGGLPEQVLPRLSDGAYDLFLCGAAQAEAGDYLEQSMRLLRAGGVFAVDEALWHDRVADASARDPQTVAVRELGRAVREDVRLVPALLPVGDGLLVAIKL